MSDILVSQDMKRRNSNMSVLNINTYYNCETCEAADVYGNGCKNGLLFPILLMMCGETICPKYKFKNKE